MYTCTCLSGKLLCIVRVYLDSTQPAELSLVGRAPAYNKVCHGFESTQKSTDCSVCLSIIREIHVLCLYYVTIFVHVGTFGQEVCE